MTASECQPRHEDRPTGWVVVAWFDGGQTFGFAWAHRTHVFNHLLRQFGGMQQVVQALGSCWGLVRAEQVAPQFAQEQAADAIPRGDDHRDRLQKGAHQSFVQQLIQSD